ncbi:MAG: hypothetical protein K6F63_07225 [Lachnospiraceae bacterium]|nr:hypothetical protein [Lachnospiraceae bacterium]
MRISEKDSHVGLGTPSVILILLVVSMVVFALLALRSAQGEKKLADKTAEAVREYYALETTAEMTLAAVNETICRDEPQADKIRKIKDVPYVTEVKTEGSGKKTTYVVYMYVIKDEESGAGIAATAKFREDNREFDITEWRFVKEEPEGGYEMILPD